MLQATTLFLTNNLSYLACTLATYRIWLFTYRVRNPILRAYRFIAIVIIHSEKRGVGIILEN